MKRTGRSQHNAQALPAGFPTRICIVPGWATPFSVPRHIVRIDVDEPGAAGTHGWQVRYRTPSRFFSDAANRTRRVPRHSLKEATLYLASIYAGPAARCRTTPTRRKANPVMEAGLRLISRRRPGKAFDEVYVEVSPPTRSAAPPRFYVGTRHADGRGTATQERFERALALARRRRAQLVRAHNAAKPVWLR